VHARGMMADRQGLLGRYGRAQTCEATKGYNNDGWRMMFPYFISALLAQKETTTSERVAGVFGAIVHVGVWVTVFIIDSSLLAYHFTDISSTKHMLQLASFFTLLSAGTVVAVCWLIHLMFGPLGCCTPRTTPGGKGFVVCWNEALLPPFLSSTIVSMIRASREFTKFLLLFVVFEPVAEVQGGDNVSREVKNLLIVLIVLKYYGASLTESQHKFKLYDEAA